VATPQPVTLSIAFEIGVRPASVLFKEF